VRPIYWAYLAAAGSAGLLLGALFFQYVLGMAPCQLCIWQRWPHLAAAGAGALLWLIPTPALVLLGALAAATSGGIGLYHAGVEQGWFEGPSACSGGAGIMDQSVDDLLNFEQAAPVVRCDEIPWEFLGVSMAGWNAVLSLGLAAVWLLALRRR